MSSGKLYAEWKISKTPEQKLKIINNAPLQEVCELVQNWNWDDGVDILITIARSNNLTLFYACHLFVLGEPDYYDYNSDADRSSPEFELLTLLHKGINSGRYIAEPSPCPPEFDEKHPSLDLYAPEVVKYVYHPELKHYDDTRPYTGQWRMKRGNVNIRSLGLRPVVKHYRQRARDGDGFRIKDLDQETVRALLLLDSADRTFFGKFIHFLSYIFPAS